MTTYVALLYSIVLSAEKRVVMSDLRRMVEQIGYTNVRTLVSTGNLVFEARKASLAAIERKLEASFEQAYGKHVDIIARDAEAWLRLAGGNPFPDESRQYPDRVGVRVMRKPVAAEAVEALEAFRGTDERIHVVEGDIWCFFARDPGSSRLLSALGRKPIGIGTSRNWNTVCGIARMLGQEIS